MLKAALDAVVGAICGSTLLALLKADRRVHALLADTKRKRKRQFCPAKPIS
jgi:hypothetical protein